MRGTEYRTPSTETAALFVHFSGIIDNGGFCTLNEHDRVSFEVEASDRGPKAASVQAI